MLRFLFVVVLLSIALADDYKPFDIANKWFETTLAETYASGGGYSVVVDGKIKHTFTTGRINHDDTSDHITEDTYFGIGSVTKPLTAIIIQQLIEEGECSWDSTVSSILPFWQSHDMIRTHMMTLSDLALHKTGFGAYTGTTPSFGNAGLSLEDFVYNLKHFVPLHEFRGDDHLLYNNAAWNLAGYIIEYLEDTDYREVVQKRIADKLQDKPKVYWKFSDLLAEGKSFATSYIDEDDVVYPITEDEHLNSFSYSSAPAGGAIFSLKDMSILVRDLLNGELLNNPDSAAELVHIGNHIPLPMQFRVGGSVVVSAAGIARGLWVHDVMGARCFSHGGNTFGHTTFFMFCPNIPGQDEETHDFGFVGFNNIYGGNFVVQETAYAAFSEAFGHGPQTPLPNDESVESAKVNADITELGGLMKPGSELKKTLLKSFGEVDEDAPEAEVTVIPEDFPLLDFHHTFYGNVTLDADFPNELRLWYNDLEYEVEVAPVDGAVDLFTASNFLYSFAFQCYRCPNTGKVTSIRMFTSVGENPILTTANYLQLDTPFIPNNNPTQPPKVVKFVEPAVHSNNVPLAVILAAVVSLVVSGIVLGGMYLILRKYIGGGREMTASNPLIATKV
ncbi:hypothetical protein P9112_004811 [Eukaryota sp. TZLM1-RC]